MRICAAPSQKSATSAGTIFITLILLIGLPLLGIVTAGEPMERYLEFPPLTRYVIPAAFSWAVFISMTAFVAVVIGPIVMRVMRAQSTVEIAPTSQHAFPWWGWAGLIWLVAAWVLAWNRFDWFEALQRHTFTPLWIGYIVVVNALTFKRSGTSVLTDRPGYLVTLFFVSSLFWWYFEYLNRFVQNWYYAGIGEFSIWEYVLFGTLSFSTVLPAVISTRDLLDTYPRLSLGMNEFIAVKPANPCFLASIILIVSAIALANIGRYPNYLFPLLWVAPLLVLVSLQVLRGEAHIFQALAKGDWQSIWLAALAALICGLFWELWNLGSLAHWEYAVPFVHRYQIFEMPLLGYAGYLPFGIECLVISRLVEQTLNKER